MKRIFIILGLCGLLATVRAADPVTEGWDALSRYKPDPALDAFDAGLKAKDSAEVRAARFGRAVTLLTKQPLETSRINEARGIFTELAASGSDDVAQGSLFYLGRIAQHHQEPADPVLAANYYRQLIDRYEASIWAQTALPRLGLLEIYALNREKPAAQRATAAEQLFAHIQAPEAARDLHLAVAAAIFYYHLPDQRAFPHLLAAEKIGGLRPTDEADLWVQIAEFYRLAGNKEQASLFYNKVISHYPRDPRAYMLKQRVAELAKVAP